MKLTSRFFFRLSVLALSAAGGPAFQTFGAPPSPEAQKPMKTVRFSGLPYGDHSYAIIGVQKGFFKDVGIDLSYETIKIEEVVPSLANGTYDIASVPPGILFASYDTAPELRNFTFGDLFQGYALMGRPSIGLKGYTDFRAKGLTHDEAVTATVEQMKGKTFAYPTETAIKPFIDLLLEKGHLQRDAFTALVLDDPLTVNAMRKGQADFQVGGVPSRITLQKEGFLPLVSSVDLARGAKASPTSKELASILENGWATTKKFYEGEHPTILKLASVNYRIMKFMKTERDEAIRIHMAYLTRITGQSFDEKDGKIIYDDLDPFYTFEEQRDWFHDPKNPLYYANVNGAILASFIGDKIYRNKAPTTDDIIFADDIYNELESLRKEAEDHLAAISPKESTLSADNLSKLNVARAQFQAYNYYDAARLSGEVESALK